MSFKDRFSKLSITINKLEGLYPSPNKNDIDILIDQVKSIYKNLSIYNAFGRKSLNYLIGLSARYALNTIGEYKNDGLSYTLWLSLIWIIDGTFDKFQENLNRDQLDKLINIFNKLNDGEQISIEDCECNSNNLIGCLPETIKIIYSKYLDLIKECRNSNPEAFNNIVYWLMKYFDSIFTPGNKPGGNMISPISTKPGGNMISSISTKPGGNMISPISIDLTIEKYKNWRLDSGAMMCVTWHLMMYGNIKCDKLRVNDILFENISLIVSYHNDILSFDRDIKDNVPNLVKIIKDYLNLTNLEAFKRAICIINKLYIDTSIIIDNYDENIKKLSISIVEGSHNWAIQEDRYKIGFDMLNNALNSKDINNLLIMRTNTPGDPTKF